MDKLETHQDFNPAIKIAGIEEDKKQETSAPEDPTHSTEDPTPFPVKESGNDEPRNSEARNDEPKNDEPRNDADRSDLGLSMFDEEDSVAEKVQKPKPQGDLENMFATNN